MFYFLICLWFYSNLILFTGALRFSRRWLLRVWSSGLWHRVVLWGEMDVSEEHAASTFKVEMCRFRNRLRYMGTSRGRSWNPRREGKEMNPVPANEKWTKMKPLQVAHWLIVTGGKRSSEGKRAFPRIWLFWRKLELCEAWDKNASFQGH
jgi:hypothetical protein